MTSTRGPLICFEGCDKTGKSTLINAFASYLETKGTKVKVHSFPNRQTALGQILDKYLKRQIELDDKQAHELFNTDRRSTMQQYCEPNSSTVILDRYVYSGCAYTVAKGQLTLEWCFGQEKHLPKPDLIFFIKSEMEHLSENANFGEERFENLDFQKKVYHLFEQMFKNENNVHVVNTKDQSISESLDKIVAIYNQEFRNVPLTHFKYF